MAPEALGYSAEQKQLLIDADYRDSVRSEAYDVARYALPIDV